LKRFTDDLPTLQIGETEIKIEEEDEEEEEEDVEKYVCIYIHLIIACNIRIFCWTNS
jgi:hypothetical protein